MRWIAGIGGVIGCVGTVCLGGLTVSLNYTRQFNRPINEVSMQMNTIFAALAGSERIFEVLDEQSEPVQKDMVSIEQMRGYVMESHS